MKKSIKTLLLGGIVLPAVMLTACGNTNYTISFNSYGFGNYPSITISESGKTIYEPKTPERIGYTFDGWYNGDKKWNFETDTVSSNVTLTARWTPIEYTITYNVDEGVLPDTAPITYTIEDSFTLPTPTKDGFAFYGWYDGTNWEYHPDGYATRYEENIPAGTYGNITLYARWDMYTLDGSLIVHNKERLEMLKTNLSTDAILTCDIDLDSENFTPIGTTENPYNGNFNGNGHTIKNFNLIENGKGFGLFGAIYLAEIKNLTVKNFTIDIRASYIDETTYLGGLVGESLLSTIENCHTEGSISFAEKLGDSSNVYDFGVGGLAGFTSNTLIKYCSSTPDISSPNIGTDWIHTSVGGLVGSATNNTTIDQCYTTGILNITNNNQSSAGGITGSLVSSIIKNSYSTATINTTAWYQYTASAGGITSWANNSTISNCYYNGSITSSATYDFNCYAYAAGIAESAHSTKIINCFVNGNFSASVTLEGVEAGVAAIVYYQTGSTTITDCYQTNTTTLTATADNGVSETKNHNTVDTIANIKILMQASCSDEVWDFDAAYPQLKFFNN